MNTDVTNIHMFSAGIFQEKNVKMCFLNNIQCYIHSKWLEGNFDMFF